MTTHTPTPWIVGATNPHPDEPDEIAIMASTRVAADGHYVAVAVAIPCGTGRDEHPEITQANAAFIVRACNSFDDLVRALEECREALQWCGGSDDFSPEGQARVGWDHLVVPALANARSALTQAQARGGAGEGES